MTQQRLLLHTCCAPCASAILEHLYPWYDITCLFYNPNITNADEQEARLNELRKLVHSQFPDVTVVDDGASRNVDFFNAVSGYETDHEGGRRCMKCYALRLSRAAEFANTNGFEIFTTTLTISPYKNSNVINSIGTQVASNYPNLMYLPWDFGYLYTRSLEISSNLDLYQQDYCGCIYSKSVLHK